MIEICHSFIQNSSDQLKKYHNGTEVFQKFFELQGKSNGFSNKWASYSSLRSKGIEDLSKKVDLLLKDNIFEMKNGKYRFKSKKLFSAGILAFT